MKCPKCQAENPDKRKFCRECGAKLLSLCPQCGAENPPDDKFCGECGHSLAESAAVLPVPPTPSPAIPTSFANKEFREMKMQPSLERALRHKEIVKA